MDFSGVSNIGVVSLAKALYHNSAICVLKLNGKIMGEIGAVSLFQTLHHNSKLRELQLAHI
jgi:hypothetical protein